MVRHAGQVAASARRPLPRARPRDRGASLNSRNGGRSLACARGGVPKLPTLRAGIHACTPIRSIRDAAARVPKLSPRVRVIARLQKLHERRRVQAGRFPHPAGAGNALEPLPTSRTFGAADSCAIDGVRFSSCREPAALSTQHNALFCRPNTYANAGMLRAQNDGNSTTPPAWGAWVRQASRWCVVLRTSPTERRAVPTSRR